MPLPRNLDRRARRIGLALALLAFLAFLPALTGGFVVLDDDANFIHNPDFAGLGWTSLVWAWKTRLLGVYQPLAWLLLSAERSLFGLEAWGYHLTSLLLHAGVTVALYLVTAEVCARLHPDLEEKDRLAFDLSAALPAALFAIHPLRTEAVAWISCQPYLPATLCALLSVRAYLRAPEGPGRRLLPALGFYTAACLFKSMALALPAVFPLLDLFVLRRPRPGWLEKVPFAALGVAGAAIALYARSWGEFPDPGPEDLPSRLVQAGYGVWLYLAKTLVPLQLNAVYPLPEGPLLQNPPFVLAAAAVLVVSTMLLGYRRRYPGMLAAWLGYLVLLAPVSGILPIGNRAGADRYSYLATIPWVIAAGPVLLAQLRKVRAGWTAQYAVELVTLLGCLGALVMTLSWRQAAVWKNSETLWGYVKAHGGGNSIEVISCMGAAMAENGQLEASTEEFHEALRRRPNDPRLHYQLGRALLRQNKYDDAIAQLTEALALAPEYIEARASLGAALLKQEKYPEAEAQLLLVTAADPSQAIAHFNLGTARVALGRQREAGLAFSHALELNPQLAEARISLAGTLSAQGRVDEAIQEYQTGLKSGAGTAGAHYNLGVLLARRGRLDEARGEYQETLKLDPRFAQARNNLGTLQASQGHMDEGMAEWREALKVDPKNFEALYNLGTALAWKKDFPAAAEKFAAALRVQPSNGNAKKALVAARKHRTI